MPYQPSSMTFVRNFMGALIAPPMIGLIMVLNSDTHSIAGIAIGVAGIAVIAGGVAAAVYLWKRL